MSAARHYLDDERAEPGTVTLVERLADMTALCDALNDSVAQLTRAVDEYKRREKLYARAISEMAVGERDVQTIVSAGVVDKAWEVVMQSGDVWRREQKSAHTASETRYWNEWVAQTPIPGTRAAIRREAEDALSLRPLPVLAEVA